jgi:hypothetical protein
MKTQIFFHSSSRFSSSFACCESEELAGQNQNERGLVLATIEQFARVRKPLKEHSDIITNAEQL